MQNMPFDMILSQPLAETFQCGGMAANMVDAHNLAWNGLHTVLADDHVEAWSLKVMQHTYVANRAAPGVQFVAEFVRNPEYQPEEE